MRNCLHCANWRIATKQNGKTVLLEMAIYKYGQCTKQNVWEYFGQSHTCNKFEQAQDCVVSRRIDEVANAKNKK